MNDRPVTIILGIDPGSRITGYGVVRMDGNRVLHVDSGLIKAGDGDLAQRLQHIHDAIAAVIHSYQPAEVAIEKVFMNRNADSALKLGQARGAAIVAAGRAGTPLFEYTATQVKQAIVGRGHAQKHQVQHMIKALLCLAVQPATDEADALAIAICHGHTRDGLHRITLARGSRGDGTG